MQQQRQVKGLSLYFGLFFLVSAGVSLSQVWIRQKIAEVGANLQSLERSLETVDQKNRYLDAKIAAVHHPEHLKRRIAAAFAPPEKYQIIWVTERAEPSVIASAARDPFKVSLDLSMLESWDTAN